MNSTPPPLDSREPRTRTGLGCTRPRCIFELLCFASSHWMLINRASLHITEIVLVKSQWLSCEYHRHRHFLDPRPSTDHSSDNPDTHPALPCLAIDRG
ncbi:hypothetical protein CH063_07243 [Colletotrichum higginsianum]|uniref:Uncharacterized protein n=1 Tax=Colletotrichum higginsianum (strain IMI 349063) TaxID=759273 RepID=H1V5G6_COLHI|nr:hypothetical protein CH063_07243 [Colletotrichum higginsianum]